MNDNIDPPESYFHNAGLPVIIEKTAPDLPVKPEESTALTPQQARIEAVGNVLHKAYEKASTLELTPEQIQKLKAEFPDEAFKLGAGGNPDLIYIEHAFLRDRFDEVIGMGQWALIRTKPHWAEDFVTAKGQKAVRIYAECALLIRGCLVSESIGDMMYYPNNPTQSYSDAAEGSVTAAFRRCAKNFGVGLQAWKKDFCIGWMQRHRNPRPVQTAKAASKPVGVPETEEQKKEKFLIQFKGLESYAVDLWKEMGILLPNEEFNDFPKHKVPEKARAVWDMVQEVKKRAGVGKPPECPQCKSSDYTEIKQGNKTIRRCNQCKHEWQSVSGTEQSAGEVLEQLEPKSKPIPENALSVAGTIMTISEKKGTKTDQQGKIQPWTRYGIKDNNGNWYNTFDKKLAQAAKELMDSKQTCQFVYTEGKFGKDLVNIE